MAYRAPLSDFRLILGILARQVAPDLRNDTALDAETAEAILSAAAQLSESVLAPLNRAGDRSPARLVDGAVLASPGFVAGYRAIAEGGWVGMAAHPDHGGMGLPIVLASCANEMMAGANLALQLNPILTQGHIEALAHHGSADLKARFLPHLVSGKWSGTMNLTEPQAGSDVGALRSTAVPSVDGTYRVSGQKIFITWGDSDLTENICHLVLARLPDAPAGTRGISLFLVPKFLPDASGQPGARNAVTVLGVEHKLGIHGSPTCVLQFDAATGWLVGDAHKGMAAMFTMMNNARLAVATQGVGVAEAAFQEALAYAETRTQGETPQGRTAIIDHADVRRMLVEMRAQVFAARAIVLDCAAASDLARATGSALWRDRAAFLTPIAKAFATDVGCAVADMAVQVHGGMGYIEETGVAQYLRDVRITPIYEGTNGIQAMDLVGRKLADGGNAARAILKDCQDEAEMAEAEMAPVVLAAIARALTATQTMLGQGLPDRGANAAAFLRGFASVLGACHHLRAARAAPERLPLARAYVQRLLPLGLAHLDGLAHGSGPLFAVPVDLLRA